MSYQSEVLADNPLLYLRCEEPSGATIVNIGSLGGNATAQANYTRNAPNGGGSDLGVALSLELTSGYADFPDNASLDLTGNFTYECWVKCDNFTATHWLMSKGETGVFRGYSLRIDSDRALTCYKGAGGGSMLNLIGVYPNDINWHHVAVTRSGNTYTGYIDGVSVGSGTSATTMSATSEKFCIGMVYDDGGGSVTHKGDIDEVAVYSTTLSAIRIAAHYAARNAVVISDSALDVMVY